MKFFLIYYYGHGEVEGCKIKEFKDKEDISKFIREESILEGEYAVICGKKLLVDFDNRTMEEMAEDLGLISKSDIIKNVVGKKNVTDIKTHLMGETGDMLGLPEIENRCNCGKDKCK